MEINDEYIIEKYKDKNKKVVCKIDKPYLSERFENCDHNEALWLILHDYNKPKCVICGKDAKWVGSPRYYNSTCGDKTCVIKHNQQKIESTILRKYGVKNIAQSQHIKDKIADTNYEKYGSKCPLQNECINTKSKHTCLEKYGTEIPQQLDTIKRKITDSIKLTCLNKYGVSNVAKLNEVNKKRIHTCIERYGKGSVINADNICKTKRINGTFNTSKPEEQSYILLLEKYNDVIRQYKSKEYPFACDFYIPSINLYIECNYHWTHGYHPFDEHNINDINRLKELKDKYGDNWWHTWTEYDVKKREIAKQNNLNYLEFWNLQELREWVNKN